MNIAYSLRLLLIAAVFAYPFLASEGTSGGIKAKLDDLIFVGIVFLGFSSVSFFGGCMRVILSHRQDFSRPSLRAPIFSGRSPVQFFWYGGLLFISGGIGVIASDIAHSVSFDGMLIIAGGLGLYIGSILTIMVNACRFLSHTNKETEQTVPSDVHQLSNSTPSAATTAPADAH